MRSYSHLNTAKRILESYDGAMPFAAWLKEFFRAEKKFGSTDRKQISNICYCFYRLGNAFKHLEIDERLLTGLFLCSSGPQRVLEEQRPAWNQNITLPLSEKIISIQGEAEAENIFPFTDALSDEIERQPFQRSFLIQPDLFLRIRPGAEERVPAQLQEAGIPYQYHSPTCLALNNQTKIEEWLQPDRDVVIQDASSQQVLSLFQKQQPTMEDWQCWDCCAASGGKTMLLHDLYPKARLTVSDIRESILMNLQSRFRRAGIRHYEHFVGDVSSPGFSLSKKFDLIICDAPCSGSGTWARTPEQLYFFTAGKIDHYAKLQKDIAKNAVRSGKKGGYFLYITCSVFKKENEDIVAALVHESNLELLSSDYFKGYEQKADTLFAALFQIH